MVSTVDPYPGVELLPDPLLKQALRFIWDRLGDLRRQVKGPTTGTISPDQKPVGLTQRDAGTRFFSTDFAREYIWTGVSWTDAPDAPARFQVAFFVSSPEPPIGWVRCDGRSTLRSTSIGTSQLIQTQVVPADSQGNQAFMRV